MASKESEFEERFNQSWEEVRREFDCYKETLRYGLVFFCNFNWFSAKIRHLLISFFSK